MGFSGYAEIPDRYICFETGLTNDELAKCKEELSPKVLFKNDWVFVVNIQKHDPISGENNPLHKAKDREIEQVPTEILSYFTSTIEAPTKPLPRPYLGSHGNGNGKGNGNKKGGVGENKPTPEQLQTICDDYQVPMAFVESKWDDIENWCVSKGKGYRDYYRALRDWVKRDAIKLKQEGGKRDKYAAIDATNL